MKFRTSVAGAAFGLLLGSLFSAPATVEAQGPDGRWPLQPRSSINRVNVSQSINPSSLTSSSRPPKVDSPMAKCRSFIAA